MVAANKKATELRLPSGKIEVITSNVFVTVAHIKSNQIKKFYLKSVHFYNNTT